MRMIVHLDENRHGHIIAQIMCSQFTAPKPIHLIIDTGSTNTTLLPDDVTRLAINCGNLQLASVPSETVTGMVHPYLLPEVDLMCDIKYGWLNRNLGLAIFKLRNIHCMPPTQPQLMTQQRIMHACSLLGMDVLGIFRKWKWKYNQRELLLET